MNRRHCRFSIVLLSVCLSDWGWEQTRRKAIGGGKRREENPVKSPSETFLLTSAKMPELKVAGSGRKGWRGGDWRKKKIFGTGFLVDSLGKTTKKLFLLVLADGGAGKSGAYGRNRTSGLPLLCRR